MKRILLSSIAALVCASAHAQAIYSSFNPMWHTTVFTNGGPITTYTPRSGLIFVTACGSGGSGAGGNATGGAGGGGASSPILIMYPLPVTPGSLLTITVPGATTGGTVGANGAVGVAPTITGGLVPFPASGITGAAQAGGASNGGNGGAPFWGSNISNINPAAGGANAGAPSPQYAAYQGGIPFSVFMGVGGGAGAGTGGGGGGGGRSPLDTSGGGISGSVAGGANIGGGAGGGSLFGDGGTGGATSVAGTAASTTAYCAGGGGGGQNAAGGNGAPGVVIISEVYG